MSTVGWATAIGLGYLCGSIPFAVLIAAGHGVDLRKVGSGNPGATNCGRVLGKRWGLLCFVLDLLKGFVPVLAAGLFSGAVRGGDGAQAWWWLAVAVAAVLGHVFSIFLKFRGGKGVATGLGVILAVWPWLSVPAVGALFTWVVLAASLRYVGLASVAAAGMLPAYAAVMALAAGRSLEQATPYLVITSAMALLITARHVGNLARTWAGTESMLGARKKG